MVLKDGRWLAPAVLFDGVVWGYPSKRPRRVSWKAHATTGGLGLW